MKKIQKEVDKWMNQWKEGYWKPHEMLARLMEETGELAREINHTFGPKKKKTTEDEHNIADEMADIVFTLACIANSQKIDLDEAFGRVIDKLYKRDRERWEKKAAK